MPSSKPAAGDASAPEMPVQLTAEDEEFRGRIRGWLEDHLSGEFAGLRAMGLIRGGSLENAIVLADDRIMNGPLRFDDEFVRHKALDMIGDLALLGLPLLGRVEGHKAGHALHTELVTRLLADPSLWTETTLESAVPAKTEPPAAKAATATALHASD